MSQSQVGHELWGLLHLLRGLCGRFSASPKLCSRHVSAAPVDLNGRTVPGSQKQRFFFLASARVRVRGEHAASATAIAQLDRQALR